jgi:hypothetical protein
MLLALKVLLAPMLVAVCTLIVYRRGEAAGGWLLGLPLVSGPVSILLFLEHGPRFARDAASGTLLGLVAAAAFCSAYALIATRQPWWQSLIVATVACAATATTLVELHPGFAWSAGILLLVLGTLPWVMGAPRDTASRPAPGASDVVARMLVAGTVVFLVTSGAGLLGAAIAGAIAPLPVIAAVMAVSLHRASGHEVADNLLRGTVIGSWGGAAFFAVVGLMMAPGQAVETYVAATVAALVGAFVATRVQGIAEAERNGEHFACVATPALTCSWRTPAPASRVRW